MFALPEKGRGSSVGTSTFFKSLLIVRRAVQHSQGDVVRDEEGGDGRAREVSRAEPPG